MEDGKAKPGSPWPSTGRDTVFWEQLTIVAFLSPFPLIDLMDIDLPEEVDGDNENAMVHIQAARMPAFWDLWEAFNIMKEAREIF